MLGRVVSRAGGPAAAAARWTAARALSGSSPSAAAAEAAAGPGAPGSTKGKEPNPLILNKVTGTAGGYAQALYSVAYRAGQVGPVEKEFDTFMETAAKQPGMLTFLTDPTIEGDRKLKSLTDLLTAGKFQESTANFLKVVTANGRANKLEAIHRDFRLLCQVHFGEIHCKVTSARALTEAEAKQCKEMLQKMLVKPNGKHKVILTQVVDESIQSGYKIETSTNKMLDQSFKARFQAIERIIQETYREAQEMDKLPDDIARKYP